MKALIHCSRIFCTTPDTMRTAVNKKLLFSILYMINLIFNGKTSRDSFSHCKHQLLFWLLSWQLQFPTVSRQELLCWLQAVTAHQCSWFCYIKATGWELQRPWLKSQLCLGNLDRQPSHPANSSNILTHWFQTSCIIPVNYLEGWNNSFL